MKRTRLKIFEPALVLSVGLLIFIIADLHFDNKGYDLKDYFYMTTTGLDGSGTVNVFFDYDKMLSDVAKDEKNAVIVSKYRQCLDTISCEDISDNGRLKNGDVVEISVSYDEELMKDNGIKIENTQIEFKIDNLSQGINIDVFEKLDVIVSGISPEAYVNLQNNWEDKFLSQLNFKADKTNNIAKGDIIIVTCTTGSEDFAANGYVPESYTKEYMVKVANSYIDSSDDINKDTVSKIWEQVEATVVSETQDLSFRILYKATGDEKFLYQYNREEVLDIRREGVYYLKKKDATLEGNDNYLVFLVKATISNETTTMDIGFAFEFSNGSKDESGNFSIEHSPDEQKYYCSDSMEAAYEKYIGSRSTSYTVEYFEE